MERMGDGRNIAFPLLGVVVLTLLVGAFLLAQREPAPPLVRSPAVSTRGLEESVDRLSKAVVRLEAAISSLPSGGSERVVERSTRERVVLPASGEPGLRPPDQPPKNAERVRQVAELEDEDVELTRRFFLWSYRDVLEHFGWPDEIWTGDMINLVYNYVDGDNSNRNLIFQFADRVVVRIVR